MARSCPSFSLDDDMIAFGILAPDSVMIRLLKCAKEV